VVQTLSREDSIHRQAHKKVSALSEAVRCVCRLEWTEYHVMEGASDEVGTWTILGSADIWPFTIM
jgi:hypothetical protein